MYNILICDDERDIVNALKIYLSDPGYVLYEAYDGMGALKAVEEHDIHLVLLDIMMPHDAWNGRHGGHGQDQGEK